MFKRIRNKKGFSMSELLMAVLILSLICVILGGGIVVVKNTYQKITLQAEAQTLLSTTITEVTDEFRFAKDVNLSSSPTSFVSANYNCVIYFTNDSTADYGGILINNSSNNDTAMLMTDKSMTSGLVSKINEDYSCTYDPVKKTGLFEATITVYDTGNNNKVMAEKAIKVRTINQITKIDE